MILVAGGTGFIGAELVRILDARNIRTRIAGSKPGRSIGRRALDCHVTDLRAVKPDDRLFEGVETIVHLASTTIPASSMTDMVFDAESNLELSLRLLEAARLRGIRNFVFASSGGTVYGEPVRLPAREDDPANPISSYGIVKLTIEKYVALYSRLHGIRGVSLRITNPYGPGQLSGAPIGIIARLLRHVRDGSPIPIWGDGGLVRDYFHVSDLMDAFLLALDPTKVPAGVYNVGSGQGVSINALLDLVKEVTGRPVAVRHEPARSVDVPQIWVDTEKFRTLTGWHARVSLEQGVMALWQELLKREAE